MKLFFIEQDQNRDYDYVSAVVAAPDEDTAKQMDPGTGKPMTDWRKNYNSWCGGTQHVTVKYLGEAVDVDQGLVCSSYNAG